MEKYESELLELIKSINVCHVDAQNKELELEKFLEELDRWDTIITSMKKKVIDSLLKRYRKMRGAI